MASSVVVEERDDILAVVQLLVVAADAGRGRAVKAPQRLAPEDKAMREIKRIVSVFVP